MTTQQTEAQERKFWKRLCALNRFSFFVLAGGVARAADKAGNWIEAHSAQVKRITELVFYGMRA